MSIINDDGMLIDGKVIIKRYISIEHGALDATNAIVLHQTDSSTSQSVFNSYAQGGNGSHFLIDKNGQIYQTASMKKVCYHVGKFIKSKCMTINSNACDSVMMAKLNRMGWNKKKAAIDESERAKSYPDRYPLNSDSIAIELVGKSLNAQQYESVTIQQNISLQWLVGELYTHLGLNRQDVYRHPEVSYKHPDEAGTTSW